MNGFANFIMSLFHPQGLKKYSNMSLFVALMIFLIEINLLFLPMRGLILNDIDIYADKAPLNVFNNIEDTYNKGIDGILESAYYITEEDDVFVMHSKVKDEKIKIYEYEYTLDEKNYKVYYVFDVNSYVESLVEDIYEKFKVVYPQYDDELGMYISMILYVENVEEDQLLDKMAEYSQKSKDEITTTIDKYSYFDLYNIEKSENSYLMCFDTSAFLLEVPGEKEYSRASDNYSNINLDISKIENIGDFSKIFTKEIAKAYADSEVINFFSSCLMYVLIYPALFAFILSLCLKNRGCLKTFKEFYNVLSLVSIMPAIVGFISIFLIGSGCIMIYSAALAMYGIFMTYKVIKTE